MLKRTLQKIVLGQKGQMLPIVLILMLLSGLLIVPTLKYASDSLKAKQVTEKKTLELYAADAGVEDALHYLPQLPEPPTKTGTGQKIVGPWKWKHAVDPDLWIRDEYVGVNGKTVDVTVMRPTESQPHKITSTASADGSSTTVTSYVKFADFSCLFDKLATSKKDIKGQGAANISADEKRPDYDGPWPTADDLSSLYWRDVKDLESFPYASIDIQDYESIGPLYREGSLSVDNTGSPATLRLDGTVYVTTDLTFEQAGAQGYTLDLNGQTIYVEGSVSFSSGCTVIGTGCIIAVGDVTFSPNVGWSPDDFVFIMSVESTVYISPNAEFYGAIAAADTVTLQRGQPSYVRTLPPDGLNFLLGGTDAPITILSWQIS